MSVLIFTFGFASGLASLLFYAQYSSRKTAVRLNDQANKALTERNEISREQLHYLERIAVAMEKGATK